MGSDAKDPENYGASQVFVRRPIRRLTRRQKSVVASLYIAYGYPVAVIARRIFPAGTKDAAAKVRAFIEKEGLQAPRPIAGKCPVTGARMAWMFELITLLQNYYPQVLLPRKGRGMLVGGRFLSLAEAVKLANHRIASSRAEGSKSRHLVITPFRLPRNLKAEAFKIPKGRYP